MAKDDTDEKLDELLRSGPSVIAGPGTAELQKMLQANVILIKSIRRLDETSSRLSVVNIVLNVVLGIIGVVQIVLMLRGH
jgi:hypothetical protein